MIGAAVWLVLATNLRSCQRHSHRTPHENVVPLTKEVRCRGDRPEQAERHNPHSRHDDIAAVTQSRFRTDPDDRAKEENTGQKADDPDLTKHLDIIIMWVGIAGMYAVDPSVTSSQSSRRFPGPIPVIGDCLNANQPGIIAL